MNRHSPGADPWFGLCRKAPAFRTAPAIRPALAGTMVDGRPGSSSSGRIRLGAGIGAASLKTIVRNRNLLVFTLLSGLAMFFSLISKVWDIQQFDETLPGLITIPFNTSFIVFDPWLFLVEAICLSCFTILYSGLLLHRNGNDGKNAVTFREGCAGARKHTGPLAVLSLAMAFFATIAFGIISEIEVFGDILMRFQMVIIWIPDAYIPYGDVMAFFYSFLLLDINTVLFFFALCLVPLIVLKKTGPGPAPAGLISFIGKTWREILGCILVYGTIGLGVIAAALVVGQLPRLLYQGYSYHATVLTHPLMAVVYYGFILGCSITMAAGFTAAGVAGANLYRIEGPGMISGGLEENMKKTEPVP